MGRIYKKLDRSHSSVPTQIMFLPVVALLATGRFLDLTYHT